MAKKKEKLRIGVGATCTVATKYLHPRKIICDKYPNATAKSCVDKLLVVKQETLTVNKKLQLVISFRHEDFEGTEVYCVKRWARVINEGGEEHLFDIEVKSRETVVRDGGANESTPVDFDVTNVGNRFEDIALVRAQGLHVDDDNEPAPENVPTPNQMQVDNAGKWGWDGTCRRRLLGGVNTRATLNNISGVALSCLSHVQVFLIFFPKVFLTDVIIAATNKNLEVATTLSEFLVFIGLWLVIVKATPGRMPKSEFWSTSPIDRKKGAPFRLGDIMSGRRFEEITQALAYTSEEPPVYTDKFWEIREMVKEWNKNMAKVFTCSWVACLDESMSIWTNRWTCPGWVFCPRKPHPIGNEYHTICCAMSSILFRIEMVEGKGRPNELPSDPRTKKTQGLLLCLCKTIQGTGKIVILDSGFCVLEALVALNKVGVFAGALIKKRRYWPKHIDGDGIDEYFKDKEVGENDTFEGELSGVKYTIMCMKEPDYVMKIMSTYGTQTVKDGQRESKRIYTRRNGETETKKFKYTEVIANHFDFRHIVDDHNNLRHQVPAIEETWTTHRWATRVFAFLLAITEVNCYLAFRYFVWKDEDKMGL